MSQANVSPFEWRSSTGFALLAFNRWNVCVASSCTPATRATRSAVAPRGQLRLPRKQESPLSGGFVRLRGKDSNLDYLIQSQASYH